MLDENGCYKDRVYFKDKEVVIAVNKDTRLVQFCWSEGQDKWIKPDDSYRNEIQEAYNTKMQLKEMQTRLDEMHSETWYTTEEGSIPRE